MSQAEICKNVQNHLKRLTAPGGSIIHVVQGCDMTQSKPLLNIKELAERLACSRGTIHNMLRAGTLPVAPVQGMKPPKWRAVDVDAFLAGREAGEA